jgi:hypothetical protein
MAPDARAPDPGATFRRRDLAPETFATGNLMFDYRLQAALLIMATAVILAAIG